MVFTLGTAFQNLKRAKIRSLVTISTAAFGIMGYLFFSALNQGVNEDTIKINKQYNTGENQLLLQKSFDDRKNISFDNLFDYKAIIPQLEKIKASGVHIQTKVMTSGEIIFYEDDGYAIDASLKMITVGLNPEEGDIPDLVEGMTLHQAEENQEIGVWISKYLAEKLHAKIGSPMILSAKTSGGSYEAIDVTILGFFTAKTPAVNLSQIIVSPTILDAYLNVNIKEQATNILFHQPIKSVDVSLVEGLKFTKWEDLSQDLLFMRKFNDNRNMFFNIFMTFIVCIGVVNTMLMSVYERLKEIGIMRAYGIRNKELVSMFMQEGLAMGILSSIMGVILGLIIIIPIVYVGIDLTHVAGDNINMSGPTILKGAWPWLSIVKVIIYNIIISTVFSAIAALSAVRKTVLQCINA